MIQRLSLNSHCFGVLLWYILNPLVNKEERGWRRFLWQKKKILILTVSVFVQQPSFFTFSPFSFSSASLGNLNWVSIVTEGALHLNNGHNI